ncbi:hypothetical protein B0X71_19715 (plasmid) [Planococcus lenghuensis]|uniref:Uncharacterized protein n=1 Tax=Planococcus lenghuensis TaxID=2213202 RepID=A0A1Q2L4L5_9BACL|nr:hypothetical protein B0X71_19715 [Planococcus lenghuensis]
MALMGVKALMDEKLSKLLMVLKVSKFHSLILQDSIILDALFDQGLTGFVWVQANSQYLQTIHILLI